MRPKEPGLYILRDPLRVVAAAATPDGGLALIEYPLTTEQAAGFAVGLARAVAGEANRIEEFDRHFLSELKVAAQA